MKNLTSQSRNLATSQSNSSLAASQSRTLYRACRKHVPESWITGWLVWDGDAPFLVRRDPHTGWTFFAVDADTLAPVPDDGSSRPTSPSCPTSPVTLAFTADEITTIIIGIARKRNDLRHDLDKKMRFGELAHAADRRKRIAQCDAMINRLNAALEEAAHE